MQRIAGLLASLSVLIFVSTAPAQVIAYDNTTQPMLSGTLTQGGANAGTANTARLVADDLLLAPGSAGATITQVTWSVNNADTVAFTARPRIRFYQDDGAGGGPGTLIFAVSFNPINMNPGFNGFFFDFSTVGTFLVPADKEVWAGETFDNASGSTASLANINNLGQGLMDPPTVGSSADLFFETTVGGSFAANNPAGALGNFGGTPVANFFWQVQVASVPEPTSMALAGIVIGGGLLRWRKKRKAAALAV